jgi:hypothetical protein
MNTNLTIWALALSLTGLFATACGSEAAGSCHDVAGEDGALSSMCGCEDGVDEDGNEETYCTASAEETIGSTEQAMGIACGMKSGGVVNVSSCRCYAETSIGLVLLGTGWDCFVAQ